MSGEEQAPGVGRGCRRERADKGGPRVPSGMMLRVAGTSASERRKSVLCLLGNSLEHLQAG